MPRIIVTADPAQLPRDVPVLLDEEVRAVHLSTGHAAAQLLQRIAWAVGDADGPERAGRATARRAGARHGSDAPTACAAAEPRTQRFGSATRTGRLPDCSLATGVAAAENPSRRCRAARRLCSGSHPIARIRSYHALSSQHRHGEAGPVRARMIPSPAQTEGGRESCDRPRWWGLPCLSCSF